jgi:hypothetical protein
MNDCPWFRLYVVSPGDARQLAQINAAADKVAEEKRKERVK